MITFAFYTPFVFMKLNIHQAAITDAASLCALAAHTFYETFRPYNSEEDMQAYITKAYDIPVISKQLEQTDQYYFAIAQEQQQYIGYVKLIFNAMHPKLTGRVAELEKIYVLSTYWDTKTGATLMQHAIDVCRKQGIDTLFLGVWQENERAVRFYKKFGFVVFDTRTFQLGNRLCEDYMMRLNLN